VASFTAVGTGERLHGTTELLRSAGFEESSEDVAAGVGLLVVGEACADLLSRVVRLARRGRLLVVLAAPDAADPWELLRAGAADVVTGASSVDVRGLQARLDRWAAVDALVDSEQVRTSAVGQSPAWRDALRNVVEIARFTTSPVLLTGETGTGKEVVARLVHELDPRPRRGELVLVDCTTVVPSLSGSEFFGHEKGAFTGASTSRAGAFERADGGTLFLDEVGELPAPMQAELLRVVQEGAYKRVGGSQWQSTRFRLIAATNRDLFREQDEGRFRRDLYYRLAAATVRLPPLRDRPEDVLPLFRHFLAATLPGRVEPEVEPSVAALLLVRRSTGNVRDLRQLAVRVASRHVGPGPITPGDIPPDDRPPAQDGDRDLEELPMAVPPQGRPPGPGPADGSHDVVAWTGQLEQVVREALRAGTGLKELRAAVGDVATRVALDEARTSGEAARLLGVSRRAVEYRRAGTPPRPG
jgi:DNA-binding NtrC family response regulator